MNSNIDKVAGFNNNSTKENITDVTKEQNNRKDNVPDIKAKPETVVIPKRKALEYISANIIVIVYAVLSLSIELFSLIFFDCSPYILYPGIPLLLWSLIILMLVFVSGKKAKAVYSFVFLLIQCSLIIGCDYLFLSNGTVFEKSMFYQKADAFATIEQFCVSPVLFIVCIGLLAGYLAFVNVYLRKCSRKEQGKIKYNKHARVISVAMDVLLVASLVCGTVFGSFAKANAGYEELLYNNRNSYQKLGISGNLFYEALRKADPDIVDISDLSDLDSFIYAERCDTSVYNGISRGNNLIMILAESFEWYPLTMYPEEITDQVYPNLTRLISDSIVCDNFYSREKTDTAEILTLVGSNPTGKYVHNHFAENDYPYSLPKLFRQDALNYNNGEVVIRSFHQNNGSFYNRSIAHKSFGFDELVDINAMEKYGVVNTWDGELHERTLDSLTMQAMKDEMFPTDSRFFTYWITFSTHGFYKERVTLSEYYELFDKLGIFPKGGEMENYLRTYAAAVADFDKALGIMLVDLENKNLLENTTIVIVADHNTYYNGLSNFAKEINTQFNPELYRVPMIIYDQKLADAMDEARRSRCVSKFTTTSDVIPTLLDLFGIPAWKNLYLGSTIFNDDVESIIYSRSYNMFITDKYIGYSLSDMRYEDPNSTEDMKEDFKARALIHLEKLKAIDKIFYSNYFSVNEYKP